MPLLLLNCTFSLIFWKWLIQVERWYIVTSLDFTSSFWLTAACMQLMCIELCQGFDTCLVALGQTRSTESMKQVSTLILILPFSINLHKLFSSLTSFISCGIRTEVKKSLYFPMKLILKSLINNVAWNISLWLRLSIYSQNGHKNNLMVFLTDIKTRININSRIISSF